MATYNSAVYAQQTGQASTGVGVPLPVPNFSPGYQTGGNDRTTLVVFDTSLQNLAIGSVINVANLPAGAVVVSANVISDTGTASATVQLGTTANAAYYSTAGVSLATAGNINVLTNLANINTQTTAPTTVTATIAGAALTTGKLYFIVVYLTN